MRRIKSFARVIWEAIKAALAALATRLGQAAPAMGSAPAEDEADTAAEQAAAAREAEREKARERAPEGPRLADGVALKRYARLRLSGDKVAADAELDKLPSDWRGWAQSLDEGQLRSVMTARASTLVDHLNGRRVDKSLAPKDQLPPAEVLIADTHRLCDESDRLIAQHEEQAASVLVPRNELARRLEARQRARQAAAVVEAPVMAPRGYRAA